MLLLGMGITLKSVQKKDFKQKTTGKNRKNVFLARVACAALLLACLIIFAAPARAQNPETVLELFTSQGCSSCPPADRLAARLAREENLLILSFAVNYWDYLGWKDTLASPITTRRQKAYARAMGNWGAVYTPQMVVNGRKHVVASRPQKVRALMARLKKTPANRIPIHIRAEESALRIAIGAAPPTMKAQSATIWLIPFVSQEHVSVSRGENAGRKLFYTNVAKTITAIGMWEGDAVDLDYPMSVLPRKKGGVAVLLQRNGHDAILGAAKMMR